MGNRVDLTGSRFERLLVLGQTNQRTKNGGIVWNCICDCGETKEVRSTSLKDGSTRSCGCLLRDVAAQKGRAHRTHGMTDSATYSSWVGAKGRCQNESNPKYKSYGARGIKVCEKWQSFENFLADMGPSPGPGFSLDRKDVDGNYEPGNCRWATQLQQQNNRRDNVIIPDGAELLTMAEYCRKHSLNSDKVQQRLKRGYSIEMAVQP